MRKIACRGMILLLLSIGVLTELSAEVTLPNHFSSRMVLQREQPIRLWGKAAPGETVTVEFHDSQATVTAGADGKWSLELPAMAAAPGADLKINNITLNDVAVGEVWLCGGQSNMQWTVANTNHAPAEIAAAANPNLRLLLVPHKMAAVEESDQAAQWQYCTPETIPPFSAVGYFFGRELAKTLNVPVGLIASNWGGTSSLVWTNQAGFDSVPAMSKFGALMRERTPGSPENQARLAAIRKTYSDWQAEFEAAVARKELPPAPPEYPADILPLDTSMHPRTVGVLYNAMVAPLAPLAVRGMIWYQGENDRRAGNLYEKYMEALVNSWRQAFRNPDMPIYFVQLAPYNYKENPDFLPVCQEAQALFADHDRNAHMAVINDIGTLDDIHPRNKQDVGRRLADLALEYTYGKSTGSDSPVISGAECRNDKVVISFKNAEKLATRDGKAPNWFELAGTDGKFYPAAAEISGNQVILTPDAKTGRPTQLLFAWSMLAEPNLVNERQLPVGPARRILAAGNTEAYGKFIPEVGRYQLAAEADLLDGMSDDRSRMNYRQNYSRSLGGIPVRIGYLMLLEKSSGQIDYVWCSFTAPQRPLADFLVPDKASGAIVRDLVSELEVASNVAGVKTGKFPLGNLEFWPNNYSQPNQLRIAGASDATFDFGDYCQPGSSAPGYGSMQLHNTGEKATVFAFNGFRNKAGSDIGIGNNPDSAGNPDWTHSRNAAQYQSARLLIFVAMEMATAATAVPAAD